LWVAATGFMDETCAPNWALSGCVASRLAVAYPWPYVNFLLSLLKEAYRELGERVGQAGVVRGEKSEVVIAAINRMPGDFSIAGLLDLCPGVGADLVRHILQTLRLNGTAECLGRGRSARWRRVEQVE
jgi:hypothetical protein